MKKTMLLLSILLGMMVIYPTLVIAGWVCDFSVELALGNYSYLLSTAVFSGISFFFLTKKKTVHTRAESMLTTLLFFFSAVHAFVYLWESKSFWIFLLAVAWVVFSGALMLKFGKYGCVQGLVTGVCLVLLFPMGLLSLFSLFPIGRNSVVQTLPSPGGTYYAEVIDSDQGALGGDTLVEVYDNQKRINLFVLSVQKKPQRVYWGDWGEFKTMKLEWQSEQVLLINGKPYGIQ